MKKALRWFILWASFLTILVGLWVAFTTPGLKPVVINVYEPPIIQPDEKTHNMGNIITDSHAEHTFFLYNVGGKPLNIQGVETSCGCTLAEISKKTIAPGDFAAVKVKVDTSIKLGHIKKKITIRSNDPQHPELKVYLVGNVLPNMQGHKKIAVKDPLVLFKGQCATCHVMKGKGKAGKALFQADCGMCHGMSAQGSVAPSLVHQNYSDAKELARLRKIIAEGAPKNPEMPPFSQIKGGPLNDAEIDSLMNFLVFQSEQSKTGLLKEKQVEDEEE